MGTRLPALGKRGEGWVAIQILLVVGVFASALVGPGWSGSYGALPYVLGAALLALGVLLLAWAAAQLGRSLTPFPAPQARDALVTTGAFALSRHPMYGGGILIALGWTIVFRTLVGLGLTIVLTVFLDLKARREEAWLRERITSYDDYRTKTTHRLLPFVY